MIHASDVASSGTILGDLVSTMPLILYDVSIIRIGTRFLLPRAGTPLSNVDSADAIHVSLSTLFGFFFFFCLLSDSSALQVPIFIDCLLFLFYANACIL